jgi:hypothetical protein
MSQEILPQNGGSVNVTPPGNTGTPSTPTSGSGTAAPTTPAEEPKVDGLTADIDGLLRKARADEKAKMYSRIEKAEAERDAARTQIADLTEKISTLSEKIDAVTKGGTPAKPSEEGSGKGMSDEELARTVQAVASTALERAEREIFGPRIAELEVKLAEQTSRAAQIEVDAYRKSLIDANRGLIIEELVTGTTKDALDEALIKAKQIFARTVEALKSQAGDATRRASEGLPPVPPVNQGISQVKPGGTDPLTAMDVSSMTDAEYRSKRAEILKQASQAVKGHIQTLS